MMTGVTDLKGRRNWVLRTKIGMWETSPSVKTNATKIMHKTQDSRSITFSPTSNLINQRSLFLFSINPLVMRMQEKFRYLNLHV